jgi:hypothetical protein
MSKMLLESRTVGDVARLDEDSDTMSFPNFEDMANL